MGNSSGLLAVASDEGGNCEVLTRYGQCVGCHFAVALGSSLTMTVATFPIPVVTGEVTFVFGVIGVAAVLMASNRVRFDIVALLVVLALMLSGVLTVGEALSGFGNPVVVMVAALLIVGEMLDRTGV